MALTLDELLDLLGDLPAADLDLEVLVKRGTSMFAPVDVYVEDGYVILDTEVGRGDHVRIHRKGKPMVGGWQANA